MEGVTHVEKGKGIDFSGVPSFILCKLDRVESLFKSLSMLFIVDHDSSNYLWSVTMSY